MVCFVDLCLVLNTSAFFGDCFSYIKCNLHLDLLKRLFKDARHIL